MMREPRQMHAVLLARNRLGRLPFFDIEHLNCFILACSYQKIALVIEIQRRDMIGVILLRWSKRLE